jgi:hypothetical protein
LECGRASGIAASSFGNPPVRTPAAPAEITSKNILRLIAHKICCRHQPSTSDILILVTMFDSYILAVLTVWGSIASIVALFLPAQGWKAKMIHVIYGIAIVALIVLSTSYATRFSRSRRAELAATEIADGRRMEYSELGYIQAALAFLEANKNLYPDTYARAQKMCEQYDCYGMGGNSLQHGYSTIDLASAMDGMLRGISAVESGSKKPR